MAYLFGYSKYKVLTLTGGSDGALTDHQLEILVSYEAAMQGDFDDIRFTEADGVTLVDAWAELIVTDTSATVFVEFPTTPANTVEQIYRMYYGNAGAASYWDIAATFIWSDDFEYADDPGNHGWTDLTGNAQTSVTQSKRGSRSLFLDASSNDRIYRLVSGAQVIEYDYYDLDSTDNSQCLHEFDAQYGWQMAVGTNKGTVLGNYVRAIPAGWQDTGIARSSGWHHIKVEFTGSVFSIWIDGTKIVDAVTEVLERILIYSTSTAGYAEDYYVDDVRTRKYASGPPTYAFGAEESVPTGHPTMRRWGGIPGMQYAGRRSW